MLSFTLSDPIYSFTINDSIMDKTQKKHAYISPLCWIIEVENECYLLAGSPNVSPGNPGISPPDDDDDDNELEG